MTKEKAPGWVRVFILFFALFFFLFFLFFALLYSIISCVPFLLTSWFFFCSTLVRYIMLCCFSVLFSFVLLSGFFSTLFYCTVKLFFLLFFFYCMMLYIFQFCYICVVLHFVLLSAFLQCVQFNWVLKFKGFVGMKASRHNFPKASRFKYKYNTQKQHVILPFLFYFILCPSSVC